MSLLDRIRKALEPDYSVERELGEGGMGVVFEALDTRLKRKVAVKVLKPQMATAVATERFTHEAQTMARLQHPGVVKVYDVGAGDGLYWFIMGLIDGETLQERLRRGPLSAKETVHLGRELLSALASAHAKTIVHRDVKPANIFIESGHAILADFGIARSSTTSGSDSGRTETKQGLGTPAYMSPEQHDTSRVGPASDLYSLGMVLYECVTNKRWEPFTSPEAGDWSKVPSSLTSVLKKALSLDASNRWPDAEAFATALGPANRTRNLIVAALGLIGVLAAARWGPWGPKPCADATSPFAPGLAVTVPCQRYGTWLAAERVFAAGNWQAADTAYRKILAGYPGCLACEFRLIEVDQWLERKADTARRTRLREHAGDFDQAWSELVAATLSPAERRVQLLDDLRNNYRAWPFAWYAFGSEIFNRGSFFGRSRNDAIDALNQQAKMEPGFAPAWTDRTLALIAAGDSAAAYSALTLLHTLPVAGGLAQAQRLLAGIAFAFRFTPAGLAAFDDARKGGALEGLSEVAAGPRVLPGLGTPLGAVELGREFEKTDQKPLQRSGLISEMAASIALGRIDSARAAGRRLNAMFPSNEFLAFDATLQATLVLLEDETTVSDAVEAEKTLQRFTRSSMPPRVRRDAAWLTALAAIRRKDPAAAHAMLTLVADEPAPAFRRKLIEAALVAATGAADSALTLTDVLATDLEAWDRAERSPLLRAAVRMSRARWFATTGNPENARTEYRWHEHFHLPDYPVEDPLAADGDWAFSTLAYWQQARLLDHANPGEAADRDVCAAYRYVAERWSLGDARYRARADTARTRLAALQCDAPA